MKKEKQKTQYNLTLRTFVYTFLIIVISLTWYFGGMPLISNYLHDIESKTYDLLFITRHKFNLNPKPPNNILIVGIDITSINKVGVPWPWPRQFHASLVDALSSAKAKSVVFDIIFDTISPLSLQTQDIQGGATIAKSSFDAGKEDDEIFATSIAMAMNVFLACEAEPLSKSKYQPAIPITPLFKALKNDTTFLGNTSVVYDRDGFVRKAKIIYPELAADPALSSAITLRVAQKYFNQRANVLKDYSISLAKRIIPNPFLINFYGPAETITTIPYWEALELIYKGQTEIFKDKIVLIGRTKLRASIDPYKSVRSPDSFPNPFASLTPNFSGVEIQATILGNILEDHYIIKLNNVLTWLLFIVVGLITGLFVAYLRTRLILCFYICMFFSIIYLIIGFLFLTFLKISIPPTFPAYGIILPIYFINFLDQYFFIDWNRRRQARIFRQMVPLQIADEIEKMDLEQLALGGIRREVTVLFADIKNFTGICEKGLPEVVVNILNQFFTEMVKVIHEHYGLVDKFIGDAIMALWGSPKVLDRKEQARQAVKCALAMNKQLKGLNLLWNRLGVDETLRIRIGINTDEVLTGNVGSPERMQFSAIGDGVNVASRLEAVNKVYGTDILISNKTAKLIENGFNLREIDTVLVPGRDAPVDIYEVIDPESYQVELIEKYSLALKEYRNKNFEEAIKYWQECLVINPNDSPSQVMLQRAISLKQTQAVSSWQPIWTIENK